LRFRKNKYSYSKLVPFKFNFVKFGGHYDNAFMKIFSYKTKHIARYYEMKEYEDDIPFEYIE
jgi:hypothetical protein